MPDLLVFIFRFVVFATFHSILAMQRVQDFLKPRMHRLSGYYRLMYNILAMATFGWTMNAYTNSPVLYQLPGNVRPIGYLVQGGIFTLLCICAAQTGVGDFLGIHQVRGQAVTPVLLTTGCYEKVRHPQYLLAVLFLLCTPTMTARWLALTLLSALYFLIGSISEERRLVEIFGESYRGYQSRVPMFIPGAKKGYHLRGRLR
ncbi:isoprenylcysteine carboxylmethyltransferase family protein [Geobacter sp. AOG1]|uniref:methyltransferase family protein n=1 Tax=Geobacter sp. AOG1 TaxID=1566346 RepID=UPI001CC6233E|nr:isoprenylcysteine carboxylmethyltransferase family protein [Geobacter sp. AOG1]GFE58694.1 hypothetical protein AOG1_25740 [Geobacter sp. AOG1]